MRYFVVYLLSFSLTVARIDVPVFLTFLLDGLRRLWPDFDAEAVAAGGL